MRWAEREQIDCLYLLASPGDATTIALAEAHGFELKDVRVTLARSGAAAPLRPLPAVPTRPFVPSDLASLEALARVSFGDTRFFFDTNFDRAAAAELYAIWLRQSCVSQTDGVFVAEGSGGPCGFITCVLRDTVGQIGLVAVDRRASGRGVGRALVDAALVWFAERGANRVEVVTQGRNIAAQRLYQGAGFLTETVLLWYHRWFINHPPGAAARS